MVLFSLMRSFKISKYRMFFGAEFGNRKFGLAFVWRDYCRIAGLMFRLPRRDRISHIVANSTYSAGTRKVAIGYQSGNWSILNLDALLLSL